MRQTAATPRAATAKWGSVSGKPKAHRGRDHRRRLRLDCGGTRIYLDANPGTAEAGGNSLVYFRADDIDRVHERLEERGVTIQQPPQVIARLPDRDVWLMWIRDSESNLVGIMEEKLGAAA